MFCTEPETDRTAAWERIYGRIAGEVRDLQEKAGSYERDMTDAYRENWDAVKEILAGCPTADECREMLRRGGYRLDAFEEMYGRPKIRDAVFYGKDLKDRLSETDNGDKKLSSAQESVMLSSIQNYLTTVTRHDYSKLHELHDEIESSSGITSSDLFVAVPLGTNRLAAPGGYNFAHGGATLQEILIQHLNLTLANQEL